MIKWIYRWKRMPMYGCKTVHNKVYDFTVTKYLASTCHCYVSFPSLNMFDWQCVTFKPSSRLIENMCWTHALKVQVQENITWWMPQNHTHPPQRGVVSTRKHKLFPTVETYSTGVRPWLHQRGSPTNTRSQGSHCWVFPPRSVFF